MVGEVGVEPTLPIVIRNRFLKPARLPVPPLAQFSGLILSQISLKIKKNLDRMETNLAVPAKAMGT